MSITTARLAGASPHTRGWTRAAVGEARRQRGFPAHAGMDPRRLAAARAPPRLPRTRGDGPVPAADRPGLEPASPHTRGWTRGRRPDGVDHGGFPAHAGMDPSRCGAGSPAARLPRTRGDGPSTAAWRRNHLRASPHTRGWTHRPTHSGPLATGFPAHAGMDPSRGRSPPRRRRLPRTRGDGPEHPGRGRGSCRASPHTRGWTPGLAVDHRPQVGFPAHAGMDPPAARGRGAARGLPRTRGDGPCRVSPTASSSAASPHTRGWTRGGPRVALPLRGFPAHAGMDPAAVGEGALRRGLPRTRGDGPSSSFPPRADVVASPHTRGWTRRHRRARRPALGFPAHAGMDPPRRSGTACCCGLPRTRGDGPSSGSPPRGRRSASPHTRGWTHGRHEPVDRGDGFPAHAGMDPKSRSRRPADARLPRTRGDGPASARRAARPARASPHTRGWTHQVQGGLLLLCGFPAHAGMDPRPGTP